MKKKFGDKIYLKNIETCFDTLKMALEKIKYQTFSIACEGNGFDKFPWNWIEKSLRSLFGIGDYRITVCTGEVIIPPEENRIKILEENHDGVTGGHSGKTKTYERVRKNFYWLVRIKTKQRVQIRDTPKRVFEKIQLEIVGPLP